MKRLELTVDLGTIRQNALAIRKRIPEAVKLLCVVKADAYGHGAVPVAKTLTESGLADAFAVATPAEGQQLIQSGINQKPIVVLGAVSEYADALLSVKNGLNQAVDSVEDAEALDGAAKELGARAKLHIKVDTGMSRIGVRGKDELLKLLDCLKGLEHTDVTGLFTHFCAADTDPEFTRLQNGRFAEARKLVLGYGFKSISHAAASTAMLRNGYQYDMVRAGIALYGTGVEELKGIVRPAQTLFSHPVSIRRIGAGETVGYSRTFTAQRDSVIATIPCGYGDGYPRLLSNRGSALIENRRVPIVGNVCMDMLMLDVTDVPNVTKASKVVLMGRMGIEEITPDEIALLCGTIPYEIMLGFSNRVNKSFIDTQEV